MPRENVYICPAVVGGAPSINYHSFEMEPFSIKIKKHQSLLIWRLIITNFTTFHPVGSFSIYKKEKKKKKEEH